LRVIELLKLVAAGDLNGLPLGEREGTTGVEGQNVSLEVALGAPVPTQQMTPFYRWLSRDKRAAMTIRPNGLVVETTNYGQYEQLQALLALALSARVPSAEGIGRELGSEWRNGWKHHEPATGKVYHYPPIDENRVSTISTRYLSEDERVRIADRLRAGASTRGIASELGRSPSTVSGEVRRNSGVTGKYLPFHAHKPARNRRARDRPGKIAASPRLCAEIHALLMKRWSPAQICQQLRCQYPTDPRMHVVHETIYRDLCDSRGGALPRELCRLLPPNATGAQHPV
jgi:hypothetical protein